MNTQTDISQTIHVKEQSRPASVGRLLAWLLALLVFGWFGLSKMETSLAAPLNQTVPPPPAVLTILTGPIQEITDTLWIVASVPVTITSETVINERAGAAEVGMWARVEGQGDGSGGLTAVRIKVLPVLPFVKLRGLLNELTDTSVVVDGIELGRTITTLVVGDLVPGQDRVEVRAAIQTDDTLLALQVRKEGSPNGDDDDGDSDDPDAEETELTGIIQSLPVSPTLTVSPTVGTWIVSGIAVEVKENTQIDEKVGSIMKGAWVKIEGHGDGNGGLVADRIRTVATRPLAELEGALTSLGDAEVTVDDISIHRNEFTLVEGDPQEGQRVKVKAAHLDDGTLLAVKIAPDKEDSPDDHPDRKVEFCGKIEALPDNGYFGEWTISGRTVVVTEATEINEHKDTIEVGAVVKVQAVLRNNELVALEIEVKERDHHDDDDDDHHGGHFARIEGEIESLPDDGGLIGEWKVAGRTIIVSAHTEIEGENQIAVGVVVKVKGYVRQEGGPIRAREIEVKGHEGDPGHHDSVRFSGPIVSLPISPTVTIPDDLIGAWKIGWENGERTVIATAETHFRQTDATPFAVGVLVEVEGALQSDGSVLARKIRVKD
jgi:hypothetical protein